jgi:multicomponent Na+:H+ antiporter subunit F
MMLNDAMTNISMTEVTVIISAVLIFFSIVFGIIRLIIGPDTVDRVVAIDLLTIVTIALIALLAHQADRYIYLDVALVYGLLSFLGVLAVARFLERGI